MKTKLEIVEPDQYNVRVVTPPLNWVRDTFGREEARAVCAEVGLDFDQVEAGKKYWISLRQLEKILVLVREKASDHNEYMTACSWKLNQSYGAFSLILRSFDPEQIYMMALKTFYLMSKVGAWELLEKSRGRIHGKYHTTVPETRLHCQLRQAQVADLPTMWGFPKARLREHSCVASGDPCCEFTFTWQTKYRIGRPLFWGAIAVTGSVTLWFLQTPAVPVWVCFPILGILFGIISEYSHLKRGTSLKMNDSDEELRSLAIEHSHSIAELLDLQERRVLWAQETQTLNRKLETTLSGLSKELKQPLVDLNKQAEAIYPLLESEGTHLSQPLRTIENSVRQIRTNVQSTLDSMAKMVRIVDVKAAPILVEQWAQQLKRRLKAIVPGSSALSTVKIAPTAPQSFVADIDILNRLTDILLINTVKYSDRGTFHAVLSGTEDEFQMSFSSSGLHAVAERIQRLISTIDDTRASVSGDSEGLELASLVRLLYQVHGRLTLVRVDQALSTIRISLLREGNPQPRPPTSISKMTQKVVNSEMTPVPPPPDEPSQEAVQS